MSKIKLMEHKLKMLSEEIAGQQKMIQKICKHKEVSYPYDVCKENNLLVGEIHYKRCDNCGKVFLFKTKREFIEESYYATCQWAKKRRDVNLKAIEEQEIKNE